MAKAKDFQKTNPLQNLANDTWGGGNVDQEAIDSLKSAKTERIKPIDIFSIAPDPLQPRRAMPSAVRQTWHFDVTKDGMMRLFTEWIQIASDESQIDYDQMVYFVELRVMGGDTDEDKELPLGDIGANLISLASLAGDIRVHGLTNPISVYKAEDGYNIETGERRWLAYHLLSIFDQDGNFGDWSKISTRIMDSFSVWRQAGENSVRSELNAISKARQLSLLLMDLHGIENFKKIHEFSHEQDYYAQVADGNEYRVPRGEGERLVAAMGLQHPRQLRAYRRLLRVSKELWVAADDGNWTEFKIRNILDGRCNDTDTVSTETVYGDIAEADQESARSSASTQPQQQPLPGFEVFDRNVNYLRGIWKRGEAMDADDAKRRAIQLIQLLQQFIDQVGD